MGSTPTYSLVEQLKIRPESDVRTGSCDIVKTMNIFPRKPKQTSGAFYFGEFDDIPLAPFSISLATLDESYEPEKPHYHTQNQKAYVTLEGEGIINVNGKEVSMTPETMIHIEPNEIHFVEKVTKAPLRFIVILSAKTDDKVTV